MILSDTNFQYGKDHYLYTDIIIHKYKTITKITQIAGFGDKRLLLHLCSHGNPRYTLREKKSARNARG